MSLRVATVQYPMVALAGWDDFAAQVELYARVAADYCSDLVVFPELLTLQLLSAEPRRLSGPEAVERLSRWTGAFQELLSELAGRLGLWIVGGSHIHRCPRAGEVRNDCFVVDSSGQLRVQSKIHPTPSEAAVWGVKGGRDVELFRLDDVAFAVNICYDVEFPELARRAVELGAEMILVPYCTDDRRGYLRVRYCAQARAVENQIYLATAGTVGCLSGVENMDIQYAGNLHLTPCDFPFARDGIAAEATPNLAEVTVADFDFDRLRTARLSGTVRNLADRRHDVYQSLWKG